MPGVGSSVADVHGRAVGVAESVPGVDAGVFRILSGVVGVDESARGVSECVAGHKNQAMAPVAVGAYL